MRIIGLAAGLILSMAAGLARADCPSGAPQGLFRGETGDMPAARNELTLNLTCADGRYSAQLYTSQGDWRITGATGEPGHVRLAAQSGFGPAELDLALSGDTLAGSYAVGGERRPLSLSRVGPPIAPDGLRPTLALTPAQWREDLKAFAEQLPRRHANAFASLPKARFDAEVAALDRRLVRLNGDQVFVNLERIANMVGDGHTGLPLPPERARLPLELGRFGDEVRVTAAGAGLEPALGARIVAIGGVPIAEAYRRALTLTPQAELPQLQEGRALSYLTRGLILHGLDITPARDHAVFGLRHDAGRAFSLDVRALPPDAPAPTLTPAAGKRGIADQNPGKDFWCEQALRSGALYCSFRGYRELKAAAAEMFGLIDRLHPARLVLDMRDNGGGNNFEGYRWLVLPLQQRADLNRKGRLYVLVGAQTFSAAMNNAAQFQDLTAATLVGQEIGETPNSYQEPRQFRLPNSHLVVRASTLFYTFRKSGPNRVTPEKRIAPSWADVKAGRDPVLDWVLSQPVPAT